MTNGNPGGKKNNRSRLPTKEKRGSGMPADAPSSNSASFTAIERTYELARQRLNMISQLPIDPAERQARYDDAWEEAELARASWRDAMQKQFSLSDHRVAELTEQLRNKIARIETLLAAAQSQAEAFAAISSAIGLATQLVRIAGLFA